MNKENPAPVSEAMLEEKALLERASAPTLRDLREAARGLFTNIAEEQDPRALRWDNLDVSHLGSAPDAE